MQYKGVKRQCEKAIDMATRPHPKREQGALSVRVKPMNSCWMNGASSNNLDFRCYYFQTPLALFLYRDVKSKHLHSR